jgi:hypothetical protein
MDQRLKKGKQWTLGSCIAVNGSSIRRDWAMEAAVDGSAAKEGETVDIGQLYRSCKWVQHLKRLGKGRSYGWLSSGRLKMGSSGHWDAL